MLRDVANDNYLNPSDANARTGRRSVAMAHS